MSGRRRWVILSVAALLVGVVGAIHALPALVRRMAMSRIEAATQRPVAIDGVDLHLLRGALTVRGFRLAERGGGAPFAEFERLDLRVHLVSLLRGHLRIREMVLRNPTVRVVRLASGFNFSDLIQSSARTARPLDITVDRFTLIGGTASLEDRALPEGRTWTSEHIEIRAHNVSTRRDDGTAVGTSTTAGAPMRIEIDDLRLYPIHLRATVTAHGLDLGMARLYLPPDTPVVVEAGRANSSVTVALDARTGVRAQGTGQFEDVVLAKPSERTAAARVTKLTTRFSDLAFQDGRLTLGHVEVVGSGSVRDPRPGRGTPYRVSTLRASIVDLTWPVTSSGRLDVMAAIPGGGTLAVSGTVNAPPAASQLRLRVANLDLAPWTQFLPMTARIQGIWEADLGIDEPLAAGVPTRVQGSIAVNGLGVRDARHELVGAQRVEATGLELDWPSRVAVKRVLVRSPRATVERDKTGGFPLRSILAAPAAGPAGTPAAAASGGATPTAPSFGLDVAEIVVRGGTLAWRDYAVTPPVALDVSRIETTLTGAGWPLRGPLHVRAAVRPPGGGQVRVVGRVAFDPLTADLRVAAADAELAPYHPYVPTAARISGVADVDVAVALPPSWPEGATVRGRAGLSRVDVRDEQRTVIRIERAAAAGLEVEWPHRAAVRELVLQRPWILLERDDAGALPLRTLLSIPAPGAGAASARSNGADEGVARNANSGGGGVPVAVDRLVIEDGGARVVDRGISPPFALDLQRLAARVDGLSTAPQAKPARLELTGRALTRCSRCAATSGRSANDCGST